MTYHSESFLARLKCLRAAVGFTVNLKQFNGTKRNEKAKIKRPIITVNGEDEGDAATMTKNSNFNNRPFPHYAPVSKHKEMKTRLGWTISYKSLYFVHPSLELVPLFTGMRERSI